MSGNPYWPEVPADVPAIRLQRTGDDYRWSLFLRTEERRRGRAPLGARRPRSRISRHAVEHALYVAAMGSHVCRPFPVRQDP